MKFNRLKTFATASLAALLAATSPASADIGWETEHGVIYWAQVIDNYGLFQYLVEEEDNRLDYTTSFFIDGLAPFWVDEDVNMAGVYSGTWYKYEDEWHEPGDENQPCEVTKKDPIGWPSKFWGTLELTFGDNPRYMTLKLFECGDLGKVVTLNGKPGE